MCNLYNVITTQQAIIEWSRAMRDVLGNPEPTVDIYRTAQGNSPSCIGDADAPRAGKRQGRLRDHQHPQAELRALAQVDGRGAPLYGPRYELRRAEPDARRQGPGDGHTAELLVHLGREQAALFL